MALRRRYGAVKVARCRMREADVQFGRRGRDEVQKRAGVVDEFYALR